MNVDTGLPAGSMTRYRELSMSNTHVVSPGAANTLIGRPNSPGPDPSRPIFFASPLKSMSWMVLSRLSATIMRPPFSSRMPEIWLNGSLNSASGFASVREGTVCAAMESGRLVASAKVTRECRMVGMMDVRTCFQAFGRFDPPRRNTVFSRESPGISLAFASGPGECTLTPPAHVSSI